MPLPKWATEKSNVKVLETKEDRLKAEQLKKTIEKEKADSEFLFMPIVPDKSSEILQTIERQYEGDALDYYGYKWL